MIKTVDISHFSSPDYVAQALEGAYGIEGRDHIYFTAVKGVVTMHASGPIDIDEDIPVAALPFHVVVCGSSVRTVPCDGKRLTFTLAEDETAFASYRLRS